MENPPSPKGESAPAAAETPAQNDSKVVKRRERSRGRFRRKRHSKTQSVPDLDTKLNQEGTDPYLENKLAGNDDKYHSMPRKSRSRSGSKSRFSGLFKRKSRSASGVRSRSETDIRDDERKSASDLPTEAPKLQGIMKNKNDNSSRSAGDINKVTAYSDNFVSYVRYSPTKQPRSRLKRMTVKDAIEERRSMFSTIASAKQQVDQNNTLSTSLPDVSNIDSIDDNAVIQSAGDDVDSAPVSNKKSFTLPRSKKQKNHKSLNTPENQFEDRTLLIHCDINGNGGCSPSDGPSTPSRVEIISNGDSQDPKKDNGESDDNSEIFFECTDSLPENKPGKSKPEPTVVSEHSDQTEKDPNSAYKSPDGKVQKHRDESRSRFLELSRKMSVVPTTNNTHIDNVIANTYLGRKESLANSRDNSPMARSSERFRSNLAINQGKRDISDSKDSIHTLSNKPSSRASTLPRMQVEPLDVIMGKAPKQPLNDEIHPMNLQDLISSAQNLNFSLIYQPMLNYNKPQGELEGMSLEEREAIHPAETSQEAQIPKLAKEEDPLSDTETVQPSKTEKQKSKKGIFFKRKTNDKILKPEKKKDKESKKITEEAKFAEKEAKKAAKEAKQARKEAKLAEKEVTKAKEEALLALKDAKVADKEAKQAEEEATNAKYEAYEADYEAKLNERETKKAKREAKQAEKEAKKAEKEAKKAAKEAKQAAKESLKATKEAKQAEKDAKEAKKEAKLAEKAARKAAKEAERKEKNKLKREKSSKNKKDKAKSRQEDPVEEEPPEKVENEPELPKDDGEVQESEKMDAQDSSPALKPISQDSEPVVKIEPSLHLEPIGQNEDDSPTLIPIDPNEIIPSEVDPNTTETPKPPVSILKVPDTDPEYKENDPYLQIPKRTERSLSDGEVKRQRESPRLFKRSTSASSGLPPPTAESKMEYKNVPQMGTSVQQRYRRTFSKSGDKLKLPDGVALLDPNSNSIESSSSIENNEMTKSSSPDEGIDMKTHDDEDISLDSGVLSRETSKKNKNNLNRPRIHSQRSFRSKKEKEREGSSEPVSRLAEISTQTSEDDLKLAYKLYIKAKKREKKEREIAKRKESFALALEKQKEEERLQRQAAEAAETLEVKTSLPLPEIRVADEEDTNQDGVAVQDTTLLTDVPQEAPGSEDQPGVEEQGEDEPAETTGKGKKKKKKKEKKKDKKKAKKKSGSIFSRKFSKKGVKTEDKEPELDDLDKSLDPDIPLIDDETFIFIENEINLSKLAEIKETDILDDDIVEPDEKINLPKKHLRFDTINLQPIQGEEPLPPFSKFGRLSRRRDSTIREKRKKCLNAFKKFVAFLFSHIGLCSLVVAYTIMGGFVFKAIEGPYESSVKSGIREERSKLVGKLMQHAFELTMSKMGRMNFTHAVDVELQRFQRKIHTETKDNGWDGNDDKDTPDAQWSFASALLYAITVMTTIGYGHVAPKTTLGRIVTIGYAVLGIPLTLLCLTNIGDVMATGFRLLYGKICCGVCCKLFRPRRRRIKIPDPEKGISSVIDADDQESDKPKEVIHVPTSLCILLIAGYIFSGALLFSLWENWDYLTGSYFCFITLSTIGFGDIVPGTDLQAWAGEEKLVLCALYLVFGLSLIAMCFNLVQEDVKAKCRWLGMKMGIIDKPKTGV